MNLEYLISTINKKDLTYLDDLHLQTNALVINQNKPSGVVSTMINGHCVRIINTPQIGLSNSRNMLLENAQGEICQLSDDDLEYVDEYSTIIEQAYMTYPHADILCFRFTEDKNTETRAFFNRPKKINFMNLSKIASVEITFRRKSILEKGLSFDPLLGLGGEFGSGEENAFLADALRAGLHIQHVPKTICYTRPIEENDRKKWVSGYNEHYFRSKGASFYRIYRNLFLLFSLGFLITKKNSTFKEVSIFKAFFWMILGRSDYIKKKTDFEKVTGNVS